MAFFIPALTIAGKSLLGLGIGTGATLGAAGVSQGALAIPGLRNLTGLTKEDIARGETYDLDSPEKYRDDGGDYLRSLFSGVSTDEVKETARQQAISDLNKKYKPAYERAVAGYRTLGLDAPDISNFQYSADGNEGTAAVEFRAQDSLARLKALQDAQASGLIDNLAQYRNASPSAIQAAVVQGRKDEAEANRKKIRGENLADAARIRAQSLEDALRAERRADKRAADQMALQLAQLSSSDKISAIREARADRQLDYQNRRLDLEDARANRMDQQRMILMLVKGLQQGVGALTL